MDKANRLTNRLRTGVASIDTQLPALTYLGLGCWMAWNLVAFSGSVWLIDTDSSWRVSDLFTIHLLASVFTLLLFGVLLHRLSPFVAKNRFVFIGAAVALVGGALVICARPTIFANQTVFYIGCVLTGAGTSCLFIRCAALFGALNPKLSFIRICESMLFACALYCVLKIMPGTIGLVLFVLLPLFSAMLLGIRARDRQGEAAVLYGKVHFTRQFWSFLAAIVVFATAAQVLKGALIPLPPAESVLSYDYMLLILLATTVILMLGTVVLAKPLDFGIVYRPATLAIIVLLVVVPLFNVGSVAAGALSSAANYVFNLMVWGMLSYLVFQAQGDAVRVFCFGNAALAAGSVLGNVFSIGMLSAGMEHGTYMTACLVLALASIFISLFVFPEHKIAELLLPIDESTLEEQNGSKHYAPWKEACERVAASHGLSERETEVFMLLAKGKTTQQVSDILVISPYTTRAHVRNIYTKLDVHSRSMLAKVVDDELAAKGEGVASAPSQAGETMGVKRV